METLIELVRAHGSFTLITVLMGGAAAYATGKALARTWRPYFQVLAYMLGMAAVTRFCHFALFEEDLLDPLAYLVDFALLAIAATIGYRWMRTNQMASQYAWLAAGSGPTGRKPLA